METCVEFRKPPVSVEMIEDLLKNDPELDQTTRIVLKIIHEDKRDNKRIEDCCCCKSACHLTTQACTYTYFTIGNILALKNKMASSIAKSATPMTMKYCIKWLAPGIVLAGEVSFNLYNLCRGNIDNFECWRQIKISIIGTGGTILGGYCASAIITASAAWGTTIGGVGGPVLEFFGFIGGVLVGCGIALGSTLIADKYICPDKKKKKMIVYDEKDRKQITEDIYTEIIEKLTLEYGSKLTKESSDEDIYQTKKLLLAQNHPMNHPYNEEHAQKKYLDLLLKFACMIKYREAVKENAKLNNK